MIIAGSIHLTESIEFNGTNLKAVKSFRPDEEDGVVEVEVEGGAISAFKTFWLSG